MMYFWQFCLFVCVTLIVGACEAMEEFKIVETNDGKIRGKQSNSLLKNIPFYAFKGIPYAKPPIGDLRFEIPEPIGSWKPSVLDAFENGPICPQLGRLIPLPFSQNEDCLTLNIFVPANTAPAEKLAVLFFIHGGGFVEGCGSDSLYGPDFIIEKGTILVTINYRVGILGFLSLNSNSISGNMGLKDQQLALQWIHANIGHFGGDNKRITIFGQSAGGASTHFHILSPESRKYFRNALAMSGAIYDYFAMSEENSHVNAAYEIAKEMGQPQSTLEQLITFLKNATVDDLTKYSTCNPFYGLAFCEFLPVIERKDAKKPFITATVDEIYEKSSIDVDAWFSYVSNEFLGFLIFEGAPLIKDLDEPLNSSIALPFHGLRGARGSKNYQDLITEVRKFYYGDGEANAQTFSQTMALLSDMNLVYGIDKSAKLHAAKSHGKTFYHRFSVDSKLNLKQLFPIISKIPGAGHADEIFYLFRFQMLSGIYDDVIHNKNDEQSKISLQTIDYITELVTNYAKYGNPVHQNRPINEFPPIQGNKINFLDICNDELKIGQEPNAKAMELWTRIEKLQLDMNDRKS